MPKQPYTQKFRKEWLQEDFCKDWIMEIPGDANNVHCIFCKAVIRAKLYDIKEHAKSKKHLENIEPFSSSRQMKVNFSEVENSRFLNVSLVVVEVVVMNILATLTKLSCGHAIEFGRCSSVSGDPYFHPDELEGLWYVIEMYKTSSRCMTITFQRTLDGFTGTEVRELLVGRRVGLDHSVSNTGVFTFKNIDNPALMKVRWPSVFIDKPADVTVVDTDGVHFAVLYECQSLWVLRRASAVILSRQPFLDEAVLQRVKEDLAKLNINTEHLTTIQHDDCQALHEADLNINLNTVVRIMKQGWQSRGRGLVTHVTVLDTVRALAAPTTPPTPTVPVRPARPAKPARPTKPTTRH